MMNNKLDAPPAVNSLAVMPRETFNHSLIALPALRFSSTVGACLATSESQLDRFDPAINAPLTSYGPFIHTPRVQDFDLDTSNCIAVLSAVPL